MKLIAKSALILLLGLLCLAMLLSLVKAQPPSYPNPPDHNPCVYVEDLDDRTEDFFETPGETVRIWTYAEPPYTVRVYRSPPGQSYGAYVEPTILVASYTVNQTGWVYYDFTDTVPGGTWWKAEVELPPPAAKGTFFVIPESPLGVITILIACLAGLGVKRSQHKK